MAAAPAAVSRARQPGTALRPLPFTEAAAPSPARRGKRWRRGGGRGAAAPAGGPPCPCLSVQGRRQRSGRAPAGSPVRGPASGKGLAFTVLPVPRFGERGFTSCGHPPVWTSPSGTLVNSIFQATSAPGSFRCLNQSVSGCERSSFPRVKAPKEPPSVPLCEQLCDLPAPHRTSTVFTTEPLRGLVGVLVAVVGFFGR